MPSITNTTIMSPNTCNSLLTDNDVPTLDTIISELEPKQYVQHQAFAHPEVVFTSLPKSNTDWIGKK